MTMRGQFILDPPTDTSWVPVFIDPRPLPMPHAWSVTWFCLHCGIGRKIAIEQGLVDCPGPTEDVECEVVKPKMLARFDHCAVCGGPVQEGQAICVTCMAIGTSNG